MGKKCHVCKKKCTGDVLKADKDKFFHAECFVCKVCTQPLSKTGFYNASDGSYVCPNHINFDPTSPLKIDTDRSKFSSRSTPLPHSPSCCTACGDHLHSGQALIALGQSWHVWCFKCVECQAVLQGEYMLHEGKPFCIRDYNHRYGTKCCECDKYIAGRVLEAGGYKFHPTCARCSRCGNTFTTGSEMYMQGNEIWHPKCQHYSVTEDIAKKDAAKKQASIKYKQQFGQHLTYMYLLPETEQTYLRQPISPHPPQPAQFHTPHGPVIKIRKSRYSMLKTGMQRLAEDMERTRPRSKSPHMDNEEPIELAHYPGAHVPDPDEVPPIDREDFPAPPYPYAVEELKRRLSSSSIENDEDDEEELQAALGGAVDSVKVHKQVRMLDEIDKDSSIAHVIKQNLIEATERKQNLPLHWDPRNASRTPSGKKMPHLRFRYDTPINASPSRHMNRPKPWIFWKDASTDRAATTQLPCFHLPQSRTGTERAITLPEGYGYYNGTLTSHLSDHSLNQTTLLEYAPGPPMTIRSSLPDMSKSVKTYPLEEIQTSNKEIPDDVDRHHLERHLSRDEFEQHFGMTPIEFYKLPEWKRINMKRKLKLF